MSLSWMMVLKALGTENGWLFHQLHPLNNWLARMFTKFTQHLGSKTREGLQQSYH